MMKAKLFFILPGVLLLVVVLWVYGHLEAYCYFWPSIDTTFATGYTEQSFKRVVTGMPATEVESLLGQPLLMTTNKNGSVEWAYSNDGKCWWGDFAWLNRAIVFSNGTVVSIERDIRYD